VYKITLLAIIPLALCRAQAPAPASANDSQHASLEGHVFSAAGEPLKKVTLRLQPMVTTPTAGITVSAGGVITVPQAPVALTLQSDSEGNFVFENLDPGRYTLSGERAGYIRKTYLPGGNSMLALTAGQRMKGIALEMTPESAISGKVFDADGDPFPKARIMVSRVQYSTRGKQLFPAGNTTTSLDGSFRVEGLSAGRYYISAQDTTIISAATRASGKAPEEGYVTTYFPAATRFSDAAPVAIAAGVESRGVDIRIVKTRVFHIRGKVLDVATGNAPGTMLVRITPKDSLDLLPNILPSGIVRDGTFDFGGLAPGDYTLQSNGGTSRAADGTTTTSSSVGRQMVTVGSSDVNDVTFRIGPGAEITGIISTESGGAPPPQEQPGQPPAPGAKARPVVFLSPVEGILGGATAGASDDGHFAMHGVTPGVYQVQVTQVPPGTYLKSIRSGNQDITKTGLDLTSGVGAAVEVVFSPNAADVSGSLHDSTGAPLAGITVTLWRAGAAQPASSISPGAAVPMQAELSNSPGSGPGTIGSPPWT
jgi:Carboxypeptidase regulatory-like domain